MSLAVVEDVATAFGRELSDEELKKVPALIDEASDLVIGWLGCEPPEPVPGAVTRVVARMVVRVLVQDASGGGESMMGVQQLGMTTGPFSAQRTFRDGATSGAPWLENSDKLRLKPYRCGGGMVSVSLSSEQPGRCSDVSSW